MTLKEKIQSLMDLADEAEIEFSRALTESERQMAGELQRWAPKEVIAHVAFWKERQLENMIRGKRGEPFVSYENYLEINDQEFLKSQKMTWEEALECSRSARTQLEKLLADLNEEDFSRTDLLPSGRPFWQGITFNWVEHTVLHYSSVLREFDKQDLSPALQESIAAALMELAPEDAQWHGTVVYNRACQHALAGQKQAAIRELKDALQLAPSLTDWSKQDTDLESLRDEAEFQAIYSGGTGEG